MNENIKTSLNASEIAGLWTSYIDDGLEIYVLKYYLSKVKDSEIRPILQNALTVCEQHVQTVANIFNEEGLPVPHGFTEEDVNLDAPELFEDPFYLFYSLLMSTAGMKAYSFTLGHSARADIRGYLKKCMDDSVTTFNDTSNILIAKGLLPGSPQIEVDKNVDFVRKGSFLSGILSKPRNLVVHEIMYIHALLMRYLITRILSTGFGQVAKSEEVAKYMFNVTDICSKHIEKLGKILSEEHIPIPSISDMFLNDSVVSPFSDRLMMQRMLAVGAETISTCTDAMASAFRSDLIAEYSQLYVELSGCAKDGIDIMIKHGWFEEPPKAMEHRELAASHK